MSMSVKELQQLSGMSRKELHNCVFPSLRKEQQDVILFNQCCRYPAFRFMMRICLDSEVDTEAFCYLVANAVKDAKRMKAEKDRRRNEEIADMEAEYQRKRITVTSYNHPK